MNEKVLRCQCLQVFETPPMGVGSLNDTARTMTYAGGGIVRAAAMAWQPFKVKIKNQAIFGEFMGAKDPFSAPKAPKMVFLRC